MNQYFNQVVEDAVELGPNLENVASDIAAIAIEAEAYRTEIRSIEADIETRKLAVTDGAVSRAGGFKGLGSNDKERSHALDMAHAQDTQLQTLTAKLASYQNKLAQAEIELSNAKRLYHALGYRCNLTAALLRYFASGHVGEPDDEIDVDALKSLGL